MLVQFGAPVYTYKSKPYSENGEAVSVGDLVITLIAMMPAQPGLGIPMRKNRVALTQRIVAAHGAIEVTDGEVAMVNELLQQSTLAPLFAEQVSLALEGKPNPFAPPSAKLTLVPKEAPADGS